MVDGFIPNALPKGSIQPGHFAQELADLVESNRLNMAKRLLKKNRLALYAKITSEAVVGIVRSPNDVGTVYVSRLTSRGDFACATEKLRHCGGLLGKPCKHMLVLLLGLVHAGKLDAATTINWLRAARGHDPKLDREALREPLIQYKGAEAGETDWRPTETLPEDFYAM